MKNNNYTFLSILFLLFSIFVLVFFTKDMFYSVKDSKTQIATLQEKLDTNKAEYEKLSKIKTDIDSGSITDINFDAYLKKFSEDELTAYFYNYANKQLGTRINSISLEKGTKNDYGFTESKINLSVTFATKQDMENMLNFLIDSKEYNFYIHTFSYPNGETNKQFNVEIPLKVLYK